MALPKQLNKWKTHLDKVRKDNPKLSLKEQMKLASKTYKKQEFKMARMKKKNKKLKKKKDGYIKPKQKENY